ncbi:MAG: hypothetical protein WCG94_06615 [Methanothrix sp.]
MAKDSTAVSSPIALAKAQLPSCAAPLAGGQWWWIMTSPASEDRHKQI